MSSLVIVTGVLVVCAQCSVAQQQHSIINTHSALATTVAYSCISRVLSGVPATDDVIASVFEHLCFYGVEVVCPLVVYYLRFTTFVLDSPPMPIASFIH